MRHEIQKEEQRKTIEVTTANADIAKQEREIELKQKRGCSQGAVSGGGDQETGGSG